jgi:hypothetical protein
MPRRTRRCKRTDPDAGPVPFERFRAVDWQGFIYWFRPHERGPVERLFRAAAARRSVPVAELPRSLRTDSDAWGGLIVERNGRATLAEWPCYFHYLSTAT